MSTRNILGSGAQAKRVNTYRLPVTVSTPVDTPWVRNPSWRALTAVGDTEQAFRGLMAVYPDSSFVAFTAAGAYTVDWGDGTTDNYTTGATALKLYDFNDVDLDGTNAPVTLTDSGDLVNRTAHGYSNGMVVQFYNIVTTTGLSQGQVYYVIAATADTFQVSTTVGGSAVALTGDGSATLLPYKQAIITVTPQAGQNLTAINLNIKHTQTGLNQYEAGWLDIEVGSPNFSTTGLIISSDSSTINVVKNMCERVAVRNFGGVTDLSNRFRNMRRLREIVFASTAAVTNMSNMFNGSTSLTTVPLFNTQAVTTMLSMFSSCTALTTVPLFNTASVTNMSSMFGTCRALTTVPLFNTASVTNMASMFSGCLSLTTVPLFNTASVTNMNTMFGTCSVLTTLPPFNTQAVTNMDSMFNSCAALTTVPLFNTQAVTSMSSMFNGCSALTTVPLFNTQVVTTMLSMFNSCPSLTTVPLFNTQAVTSMGSMFSTCPSLTTVPLFNTASVTNISSMFNGCSALTTVPLFNTQAVTSMSSMFNSCAALTTVPLFNTASVTNMSNMFNGCNALQSIPALVVNAVSSSANFSSIFSNCSSLSKIEAKVFNFTFSVASCKLSVAALEEIFTNLPRVTTQQTITTTSNHGSVVVSKASSGTTSGSTTVTIANTSSLETGMEISGVGISSAVAVTMQDTGDTITRTAHGIANDTPVSFATIVSTTGITTYTTYYVVNTTADTFQVADTVGGGARALTTDGSGTLLYGTTITAISPNVSVTLSIPASATGSVTTVSGKAKNSIARLKNWAVTV